MTQPTDLSDTPTGAQGPTIRHDARVLVSGGVTAEISLDGEIYVLRITKQGKLILTK